MGSGNGLRGLMLTGATPTTLIQPHPRIRFQTPIEPVDQCVSICPPRTPLPCELGDICGRKRIHAETLENGSAPVTAPAMAQTSIGLDGVSSGSAVPPTHVPTASGRSDSLDGALLSRRHNSGLLSKVRAAAGRREPGAII